MGAVKELNGRRFDISQLANMVASRRGRITIYCSLTSLTKTLYILHGHTILTENKSNETKVECGLEL